MGKNRKKAKVKKPQAKKVKTVQRSKKNKKK